MQLIDIIDGKCLLLALCIDPHCFVQSFIVKGLQLVEFSMMFMSDCSIHHQSVMSSLDIGYLQMPTVMETLTDAITNNTNPIASSVWGFLDGTHRILCNIGFCNVNLIGRKRCQVSTIKLLLLETGCVMLWGHQRQGDVMIRFAFTKLDGSHNCELCLIGLDYDRLGCSLYATRHIRLHLVFRKVPQLR
jgi:hypothetical protein